MRSTPDLDAILATVRDYFEGLHHRDVARLRKAFHPKACLFGHLQQVFTHSPLEQWLAKVESWPVPADVGEPFDMRILSTDVTGDAATVKVADLYRGLRFTDYLTLLKVDGRWMIVNKAYRHD